MTNSQRRTYFAGELKKALDRNNATLSEVARLLGIKYSRLHHWVQGRSLPSIHTVQQIADYFGDEEILKAAIFVNTRKCSNCGKDFIRESPLGTSFLCSPDCRSQNRRLRDKTGKSLLKSVQHIEENQHQKAIDAFCNSCEPAGLCLTPNCQLRPVSPLPLYSKAEALRGYGSNWSVARVNMQREHIEKLQPKMIAARKEKAAKKRTDKFK